jgi:hypothetical protein
MFRIRIGIQPKMLDPPPVSMNPDPNHWFGREKRQQITSIRQIFSPHFFFNHFHVLKLREEKTWDEARSKMYH